jgi:hypothetical protein
MHLFIVVNIEKSFFNIFLKKIVLGLKFYDFFPISLM